jgi:hypothetical protein
VDHGRHFNRVEYPGAVGDPAARNTSGHAYQHDGR